MTKYTLSLNILFVSFIAALSGFLFGYHTGIISGAQIFITEQFHLNIFEEGIVVSIILVGGVVGALLGGFLSDYLGRKRTLLLTCILFFFSTAALFDAQSYSWILAGRIFAGIGIGTGSVTASLYISEIAPIAYRGALVSLNQLMITLGILASFFVSYIFVSSSNWHAMFFVGLFPAILQFLGLFFVPESPAWLISQKKNAAAEKSLHRLEMDTTQAHYVEQEIKRDHPDGKSLRALFCPEVKQAFLVGIGVSVFQQITGINTVYYYAPHIFQLAGFASAQSAIYATMWIGILNVFTTLIGLWLVDKKGRRPLLLISLIGMAFSLALLGSSFAIFGNEAGFLAIVSLLVYIASFAIGLGMVPWLIISEIFPLGIRGRAMGVAIFTNWLANYLVALTFLPLVKGVGIGGAYWLFSIICFLGIWFSWKKVPETRGKTFEEIQKFWHK